MKQSKTTFPPYLYEIIKQKVDFSSFLETEIGCKLKWSHDRISATTPCPVHKEKKASFHIKHLEEQRVWIYNCFGCGSHGTIIDFCLDYYNFSMEEAAIFLCKKYNIDQNGVSITDCLKDVKKKINVQKKVECAHVVSANQCRNLLKKNYSKYNRWVAESYKKMNNALDSDDLETIESIGFEATNKIEEK